MGGVVFPDAFGLGGMTNVQARDASFKPEVDKLNVHWINFTSNTDTFANEGEWSGGEGS